MNRMESAGLNESTRSYLAELDQHFSLSVCVNAMMVLEIVINLKLDLCLKLSRSDGVYELDVKAPALPVHFS